MLVSLEVSRSYFGQQGKKVEVRTGLGGGDCGVPFEVGKQYLVYAWKDESGQLSTGICSRTGLVEDRAADLASLRGTPIGEPKPDKAASAGSRVCGNVVKGSEAASAENRLFLISKGNKSPVPSDEAEINDDGSFCAKDVESGEYYLLFVGGTEDTPTCFAYFPGVTSLSDAKTISVTSGQKVENLLLRVPFQPLYSVSGRIVGFNKSYVGLQPKVLLFNAEQMEIMLAYSHDVSVDGTFTFPQVLPGKYWAIVDVESDSNSKWFTRRVSLEVGNNVSDLALALVQK